MGRLLSFDWERVIVVTGAGSGIGAAIGRALGEAGTGITLHTRRNAEGLGRVAEACRSGGATVETFMGDLAEAETAEGLIAAARARFGRIDQIVSNAGQAERGEFGSVTAADLQRAFEAMPVAFLRLVTAALPDLQASQWGRVVAVSSFVAHVFGTNNLLFPATSAAKAALEALAMSLAVQLAPSGVTVNCVAPGFTRKDQAGHAAMSPRTMESVGALIPTGRLAEPRDIAHTTAFLLSRGARQITGQVIHVDGGLMLP